jgi:2-C-methyl-D-erythritol 4-phosphate cytidylyltransferase
MKLAVKKAVIPAAGLGTRFLPATKTVPKEMLPIVDKPIILYNIEECVRAGIQDVVLVAGRGKSAIEDFFDTSYEVEDVLLKAGKTELLERVQEVKDKINIISIRQKRPKVSVMQSIRPCPWLEMSLLLYCWAMRLWLKPLSARQPLVIWLNSHKNIASLRLL